MTMREIDSLISRHRWQLEDKRRIVAELERLADRLRQELKDLDRQAAEESESEAAPRRLDAAMMTRRATLSLSLTEVEDKVREALSEVARAIRESKTYDLAKARRDRALKARAPRERRGVASGGALRLRHRAENV